MTKKKLNTKLKVIIQWLLTSIRKRTNGSDYRRWKTFKNLDASWDSRTIKMSWLLDEGDSIIEFGAGRMILKKHLPKNCSYTPSDLVDRGEGTIICDLNAKELPLFHGYNTAFFSGVLEYVNDVPRLIFHLSNTIKKIIASYAIYELNFNSRRASGWVNDYSSKEFLNIFETYGFKCDKTEKWGTQLIYKFVKK